MFETTITVSNVADSGDDEPWPAGWIVTCPCSYHFFADGMRDAITTAATHGRHCTGVSGYELRIVREVRFPIAKGERAAVPDPRPDAWKR